MNPEETRLVGEALAVLGIRNLVLGIHDPAFPSRADEEVGRGTPYGAGGRDLLEFARALGFSGLQLGPQGRTSEGNPSPYDGMLFSRDEGSICLAALSEPEPWAQLLPPEALEQARLPHPGSGQGVDRARAATVTRIALREAWSRFQRRRADPRVAALSSRFDRFRRSQAEWLVRDGLFAALEAENQGLHWSAWPAAHRRLWTSEHGAQREGQIARCGEALEAYAFRQFLAHEQHAGLRQAAGRLGLELFGDLQVGISQADVWSHPGLMLPGYVMGAPPSRTNPAGQAWNYPVLDPDQYGEPGASGPAVLFLERRLDKMFAEYDSIRIDHPHGLVCPWVYDSAAEDPDRAVAEGARLFDSPDLPDHPELARYAIVTSGQLRRELARHADGWVVDLDDRQLGRYAALFDVLVTTARRHGRRAADLACEVLSTQPYPLRRVMERHGLGRFRVTQKVGLDDPADVYRSENAAPQDWIMPGSHDTPTLWQAADGWVRSGSSREHAEYLAGRLGVRPAERSAWIARVASHPSELSQAKLAELFVGPARNVMLYFTDLFGYREPYNRPGTVRADNWSLRLPSDFSQRYALARRRGAALDLPSALAQALEARGESRADSGGSLSAALRRLEP